MYLAACRPAPTQGSRVWLVVWVGVVTGAEWVDWGSNRGAEWVDWGSNRGAEWVDWGSHRGAEWVFWGGVGGWGTVGVS